MSNIILPGNTEWFLRPQARTQKSSGRAVDTHWNYIYI